MKTLFYSLKCLSPPFATKSQVGFVPQAVCSSGYTYRAGSRTRRTMVEAMTNIIAMSVVFERIARFHLELKSCIRSTTAITGLGGAINWQLIRLDFLRLANATKKNLVITIRFRPIAEEKSEIWRYPFGLLNLCTNALPIWKHQLSRSRVREDKTASSLTNAARRQTIPRSAKGVWKIGTSPRSQ